ncbi:MAG TPA: DUF5666 domain-containing protein [Candidatus Angelobacter sp.]|nr:DUF5666 domain-containing protein [Candidatus Angelobacter sp.]
MRKAFLTIAILSASLVAAATQVLQSSENAPQEKDLVYGKVIAVDKDSFTVMRNGETATVKIHEYTKIREQTQREPVKLEPRTSIDIKIEEMVLAVGTFKGNVLQATRIVINPMPNPPPSATPARGYISGIVIHPEDIGVSYMIGEVKAIQGSRLTVLRQDGKIQEIEVDDHTTFIKQIRRITLQDVKVGDLVSGPGKLRNNTFVFDELHVDQPGTHSPVHRPQAGSALPAAK